MSSVTVKGLRTCLLPLVALLSLQTTASEGLSLPQAVSLAQGNDPWLQGNRLQQSAVEARSNAALTLPDPVVSVSAMNLPTDSWHFNQEPMTQLKVGVSQMFPRGDTRAIKNAQLKTDATKFPFQRADRNARVASQVSQLWLDAYLARETIELINRDKALFEQMVEITKASYSSAVGNTRQQDVIRAQLELIRLDDRLVVEQQRYDAAMAMLSQWLYQSAYENTDVFASMGQRVFQLSRQLPELSPVYDYASTDDLSRTELAQLLSSHPAVLAIDVKQQVASKEIDLANQQYQPQWGLNASYGYRDDAPNGMERAGFFSVGVTFDLPLFTEKRQDQQVSASIAESEAVKTEKLLLLRNLIAEVEKEIRNLMRLSQRQSLFQQQLITQTHEQAEAALTAYTNDTGDFAEVVRARIAELNTTIAKVQIDVDTLKTIARLNYFFSKAEPLQNEFKETTHVH
ncbi:TolC family protein [Thalassotalea mangrovi]|uniref:TolC family protein n=1 Tax=Thalassotalea mangrovi TaxID=2572245 RepID=A0A4U1B9P3_9GAMM|nr:TolC family protein [Thalassotalea mangrovi]TKB47431.1 TolC family protein [Thalassotalea mangrovi]